MKVERFEDMIAWKKARGLTSSIYKLTGEPPLNKDFGLIDQIRRASGSIMHNIAEGFDAGSNAEFIRFLRYSYRSASEVQSQLYIMADVPDLDDKTFKELYEAATEIKKVISGLIGYLLKKK